MDEVTVSETKPRIERPSITYELGRMDSMVSTGSADSSSSVEIEDKFVGMNLDKNSNETNTYNEVSGRSYSRYT